MSRGHRRRSSNVRHRSNEFGTRSRYSFRMCSLRSERESGDGEMSDGSDRRTGARGGVRMYQTGASAFKTEGGRKGARVPLLVFVFILREFRARLEHIGELRGIDRPVGIAVQTVRDHVVVVVGKVPRDDPLERGPVSRAARRRSVAPSFTLQGGSVRSHVAVVPSRSGLARIVRVEVPVVGVLAHEPPAVVQAFAARGGRHFSL